MRKKFALLALLVAAGSCRSSGGGSGTSLAGSTSTPTAPVTTSTAPVTTAATTTAVPSFVGADRVNATFTLGTKPFYFAATNSYYLAQEIAYGSTISVAALDAAQAVGMKVVRTIGYDDGWQVSGTNQNDPAIMQLQPGVYRDSGFVALDTVVAEAGKRGLYLIIVLVNNWDNYGGMDQYVAWAGLSGHDTFFTDPGVKQLYKNYVQHLLTRVNTITGRAYKDEPAIFGWELANEARCASDPGAANGVLVGWYTEMSAYVKSIDPNHLVGTGEEGNDVSTTGYSTYTNGSWLDGSNGSSFRQNIAIPTIDWGTVHVYPDNAGMTDPVDDGSKWISDHARLARAAGKPFMVGEYGLQTSPHSIYGSWLQTVEACGAGGAALWELNPAAREAQVPESTDVVYPTDVADVSIQSDFAAVMNAK